MKRNLSRKRKDSQFHLRVRAIDERFANMFCEASGKGWLHCLKLSFLRGAAESVKANAYLAARHAMPIVPPARDGLRYDGKVLGQ